jgi:hypothetical protein
MIEKMFCGPRDCPDFRVNENGTVPFRPLDRGCECVNKGKTVPEHIMTLAVTWPVYNN